MAPKEPFSSIVVEKINHPGQTCNVDAKSYRSVKSAMLAVLPERIVLTWDGMVARVARKISGDLKKESGRVDEARSAGFRHRASRLHSVN